MRNLLIVLSLILAGCGQSPNNQTTPALVIQPYYKQFFDTVGWQHETDGIVGVFNNLGAIAICIPNPNKYQVYIDSDTFYGMSADQQRAVVFHELTHCVFNVSEHSADANSYMTVLATSTPGFSDATLATELPLWLSANPADAKVNGQITN